MRKLSTLLTLALVVSAGLINLYAPRGRALGAGSARRPILLVSQTVTDAGDATVGAAGCADGCSLREAITTAAAGDTIDFAPLFNSPQTITLTAGELLIDKNLTINGLGANLLTVNQSSGQRIFRIAAGNYDVTLSGLRVADGFGNVTGPRVVSQGGGIFNASTGTLTITNSTLVGNTTFGNAGSEGQGGAIYNASSGEVNIVSSTLSDNDARGSNEGGGRGGAIFNASTGTVNITNSTLSGNLVLGGSNFPPSGGPGVGGAIYNADAGAVNIMGSTLSANTATGGNTGANSRGANGGIGAGGGIYNNSTGTVTITNSTISGNTVTGGDAVGPSNITRGGSGNGGGIYNRSTGTISISSSTIAGNAALIGTPDTSTTVGLGGGVYSFSTGLVQAQNTIIAGNAAADGTSQDVYGTLTSLSHNLIGDISGGAIANQMASDKVGGGGNPVIDPLLGPLANNGGPTQTRLPQAHSPAIDMGFCNQLTDQRSVARPQGASCDIGAVERSFCNYTLTPTQQAFAAAGGAGRFTVNAPSGCAWQALSNNPNRVTIIAPAGGQGSGTGTVRYWVEPNYNAQARRATISVAGQTFTVWQGARFHDVPDTHPRVEEIGKLSALGISQGCGGGNFCPNEDITRAQLAVFLIRSLGEFNPPVPAAQRFADVPPSHPFYAFIEQMAVRRITPNGCGDGNYCPTNPVKRQQIAAFILRALGVFNPPTPALQRFMDVPPSNSFYDFIEEIAQRRIINGCGGGNFCPTENVTRAQTATFLVRAFDF